MDILVFSDQVKELFASIDSYIISNNISRFVADSIQSNTNDSPGQEDGQNDKEKEGERKIVDFEKGLNIVGLSESKNEERTRLHFDPFESSTTLDEKQSYSKVVIYPIKQLVKNEQKNHVTSFTEV